MFYFFEKAQPNIKYLSETENRFQNQIIELKKEIGNKLIDLRQLDKKIGRRKQILDTLQEGPLNRSVPNISLFLLFSPI